MNNIVLVGFSQSGKTTIGKLLAAKTQQAFIELEDELEKEYQKPISDLISEIGYDQFCLLEKASIEKLMSRKNKIIAIRSKVGIDQEIVELLPKVGKVIYLQTDHDELCQRLAKSKNTEFDREEFDKKKFQEQVSQIEPLFFKASGIIIQTTDKSPEDIVDEILLLI